MYSKNIEDIFFQLEKGKIYHAVIEDAEKTLIEKALERSYGNQITAAKVLGVHRNTLRTKIKKLNIDISMYKV